LVRIDLTGKKYGKLTVIQLAVDDIGKKKKWLCMCECGNRVIVAGSNLRSGHSTQCKGCQLKAINLKKIKHNKAKSKLYGVWGGMKNRCENPNSKSYKDYGAKGIKVCDEWHEAKQFITWALKNGYAEGLEIDRRDVNGDYSPSNCRWVSRLQNANNKGNNRIFCINGRNMTMAEIARENGIKYKLLHKHLNKGMSIEDAIKRQKENEQKRLFEEE